ncbi:globin domain-containing protein [Rhizobacter sp. J219]|uniref:globin domain-containing protein n=1 Tax=Rhizobacter sp. J219 TaxID=2898430 RepID=UPI002150A474|nr:globin domain-containing protein [Rhizobacter sp. J219]MCR5884158.1 globin domain-containing protein [Rhizobacter sp. J219]
MGHGRVHRPTGQGKLGPGRADRPEGGRLFYANLFRLDPSLKPLFTGDMVVQGEKLMKMIGVAVGLLGQPQLLLPALQTLGRRHADYGVRDEHYDTVGSALLATLQQGTGVAFTPEVREAWIDVYGVLSRTMKEAARVPA